MFSHVRVALLARGVTALIAAGCSGGPAEPTPQRRPVASVDIESQTNLWVGDERQLRATVRAADGTVLTGREVTWSSGDASIVRVDAASGRLTAVAYGVVAITATSEGKSGQIVVDVGEAELLYEGYGSGLPEMYRLSLRGGEPSRLLPPHTVVIDPKPSPDGRRIAFVVADYVDGTGDIFVVNRDGTGLKQLTFDSELDDQPAWSPDGARIAFRSFRSQAQGDIWVMNADGSNPVNLTPDPLPATTNEMRPAWSPDGSRIAYASNAGGNVDIWTMAADGTDKRRITSTPDYDTEPAWSPDGRQLAFRRSSDAQPTDIMIVAASGGEPLRLAHDGSELNPAWSPDGRLIAFAVVGAGGGSPQIYTMRPDGSERALRTEISWGGGRHPSWLRRR